MKKLLVVLLALMVIGVFAFADDAMAAPASQGQFHAWNYGELFSYASVNGGSAASGWGPSWDPNYGIDQEWTFSYDGKNFGYSGTFEFGMGNFAQSTTGEGSISWFDTYYKFGDMVKFTAGKLDIGDYRWTTFIEGGANARFGQRNYSGMIQVYPVPGLSLAVLEEVPGTSNLDAQAGNKATNINAVNYSYGTYAAADYQDNTNLAASYEMKDTFKAYFAWNNTAREASVGVNISALKPLSLQVVYDDDYMSPTQSTIWLTAGYTMGALALSLDAGYMTGTSSMYGYTNTGSVAVPVYTVSSVNYNIGGDTVSAYAAEIQAEYTMGQYAVGAKLGYDNGAGIGLYGGQAAAYSGLEVYPYVKANFDNGSYIMVGILYASGANANGATLGNASWNAANPSYAQSLFAIPISYSWAF